MTRAALVFVLLLPLGCSRSQMMIGEDPIASAYIRAVQSNHYAAAAALLHYPEEETGAELQKDKQAMLAAVRAAQTCLGKPLEPAPGYEGLTYEIAFGAGDLPHWEKHPQLRNVAFRVRFEKAGTGRLSFDEVLLPDNTWGLRQVKFGLPLADPHAQERLAACMQALQAD